MKLLLTLALIFLLSSCSLVKGIYNVINVGKLDGGEYAKASHLRTTITLDSGKCGDPTFMKTAVVDINSQALELSIYSQGLQHNDDVVKMEFYLNQITSEFNKRYASVSSVSEAYCNDKMEILLRISTTIQKSIGGKPN